MWALNEFKKLGCCCCQSGGAFAKQVEVALRGQILRSNYTVMDGSVVFCNVICIVAWARAPEVVELLLGGAAS